MLNSKVKGQAGPCVRNAISLLLLILIFEVFYSIGFKEKIKGI